MAGMIVNGSSSTITNKMQEESAVVDLPALSSLPPIVLHDRANGTPKRKASTKAAANLAAATSSSIDGDSSELSALDDGADAEEPKPKPKRKRNPPKVEYDEEGNIIKKQRKPRPPKPEPEYIIPEVESKGPTTFKGRLGYACLNTVLRNKKPAREAIFCSRTLRIDTIKKEGIEFMKELGKQNMRDLIKIIEWNEENVNAGASYTFAKLIFVQNIRFMRMSSEMFPFASHPEYGYDLEYAAAELKEAGDLAKKYGHRLTTHPGQFTQLGSPRKQVVDNAFRDLKYHCEMIDRMGLDKDSVMIIHGGGQFDDKQGTLKRIKENFLLLPKNVQERIVLENDELNYNVDDLLPLCEDLQIPLVFDYHHDWIFPSSQTPAEMMPRILATWQPRGIRVKQHLSEPRPGAVTVMEKRAHSNRCKKLPDALPDDVDLMLEAKDKEQAVFEMYRMYDMYPTIHKNLRPPAEVETLRTNGRKSNKKKKAKEEDDDKEGILPGSEDEEGNENPDQETPTKPKVKRSPKKADPGTTDGAQDAVDPLAKSEKPSKTPRKRKVKTEAEVEAGAGERNEAKPVKKARKPAAKKREAPEALNGVEDQQLATETLNAPIKQEGEESDVREMVAEVTGLAPGPENEEADSQPLAPPERVELKATGDQPEQKKQKV